MFHEIFPQRFNNKYVVNQDIKEEDYLLYYNGNSLLLKINDDNFELPKNKDLSGFIDIADKTFMFTLNDVSCFLIWKCNITEDDSRFTYKEISFFRNFTRRDIGWISVVGFQLKNWYLHNRFCGSCGTKTVEKEDERAVVCASCGLTVYPRISPAIIVAIISDNKILLAHNSNFPANRFSLVAGYTDIGESLEETVIREVSEEVGLNVKNVTYYKSQPWPFSGSMMVGFIAEVDGDKTICVDNNEITEAAWYGRDELPDFPNNASIAGEMIEKFKKGEI